LFFQVEVKRLKIWAWDEICSGWGFKNAFGGMSYILS